MSFTFRTIPLDCLALTCQYLSAMRDHCAIHSTSHHWRHILIAADRYSHAYISIIVPQLNIVWDTMNNFSQETKRGECIRFVPIEKEGSEQLERRQQMDLAKLAGIELSFSHLRSLSITFNIPSGTKKLQRQVDKLRSSFYSLLGSLTSIQHLSINDASPPNEECELLLAYDEIARALSQITTLRRFHYSINWISQQCRANVANLNAPTSLLVLPMSSALILALTRSPHISAISGHALVQTMSEDHWLTLFSSLPHLKHLGSMDLSTCLLLHSIATRPKSSDSRFVAARSQLHQIESMSADDSNYVVEWIPLIAAMKCENIRLVEGYGGACYHSSLPGQIIFSELLTKEGSDSPRLRSMTLDLMSYSQRLDDDNLQSGFLVHQLELNENSLGSNVDMSVLSAATGLRCLILGAHSFSLTTLREILTASPRLLELRLDCVTLMDSDLDEQEEEEEEEEEEDQPERHEITSKADANRSVTRIIHSHSSLHLLQIQNLIVKSNQKKVEWKIDINELKAASQRCAKMLEYAQRVTWIDLVTLSRDEIKKRVTAPSSSD